MADALSPGAGSPPDVTRTRRVIYVLTAVTGTALYLVVSFVAGAWIFVALSPDTSDSATDLYPLAVLFFGFVGVVVGGIIALVVAIWIGVRKPKFLT